MMRQRRLEADVPRGTMPQVWRRDFTQTEYLAAAARQKTQLRETLAPGNTVFDQGKFAHLDMEAGQPVFERLNVEGLAGRIVHTDGTRRSVPVHSALALQDVIYHGYHAIDLDAAPEVFVVERIRIERFGWEKYLNQSGAKVVDHRRNERDQQQRGAGAHYRQF